VHKTANVPFAAERGAKWLKNAEAAERLAVDARTIKRWMLNPSTREALSGVQHGKQYRIPRPENLAQWEFEARQRLEDLGITLKQPWQRDLEKLGKKCDRYLLESYRLWLAAWMTQLERDRITEEARDAFSLLWCVSCDILSPLPKTEMEVDKLRGKFLAAFMKRGLSNEECHRVMSYWPEKAQFDLMRAAHTLAALEAIRRKVDYAEAVRELEHRGEKPTAENILPLLHKDFAAHINGTREALPGRVVKAESHEQLRRMTAESVDNQIAREERGPLITIDFRQPQVGRKLRTYRKLYPAKQKPLRKIVAQVYRSSPNVPGVEEKPHTGKTPIRKPDYDGWQTKDQRTTASEEDAE